MHFEIYVVHTPTNALFINLVNSFKFTLKYTIISLLYIYIYIYIYIHVCSYIYVKTLGKITSFYILGDVHTTHMPLYDMLPHHLIYITT